MPDTAPESSVVLTAEAARHVRAALLLQAAVATSNATNERAGHPSQVRSQVRGDERELLLRGSVAKLDAARRQAGQAAVEAPSPIASLVDHVRAEEAAKDDTEGRDG